MKTNKSYMKRLRVTKKGKIVARAPGQNHFNAKRSGNETRRHHRAGTFHAVLDNTAKSRFLS
ncbi:MAG: 50S ribosomal protein L35 [Candidatus Pacebacteria bacterium]|nr:50S ribosomal protein L35 [Candidatus Paceibacterota bacterium]